MTAAEKDWKLYRARMPEWQEAYMGRLLKEYEQIIQGEGNPSDRFWALEDRIYKDKKCPGVQIHMSRSTMLQGLMELLADHVITLDDLEGFSEETIERMESFIESTKNFRKRMQL